MLEPEEHALFSLMRGEESGMPSPLIMKTCGWNVRCGQNSAPKTGGMQRNPRFAAYWVLQALQEEMFVESAFPGKCTAWCYSMRAIMLSVPR